MAKQKLWESDEIEKNPNRTRKKKVIVKKVASYHLVVKKAKDGAKKLHHNKINQTVYYGSNYISAVSAFPVLAKYAKEYDFPARLLMFFIIINHFRWFTMADVQLMDYTYSTVRVYIKKFIDKGWIDKLGGTPTKYSVSTMGMEKFKEIHKFYSSRMRMLLKEWDMKERMRMKALKLKSEQKKRHTLFSNAKVKDPKQLITPIAKGS